MLTRSPARNQPPKYSAVRIETTDALLAWWPPTLMWSGLDRTWLASWIIRVASHSTRCWIRSSASKSTLTPRRVHRAARAFAWRDSVCPGSGAVAFARFGALPGIQHAFSKPKGHRRHFDQLVALDEVEGLFETQLDRRR